MNKYQEAFKIIQGCIDIRCDNEIAIIQELVDKATPNVFVDQFGVVKCGNCKEPITHPKYGTAKYCLLCGQKMWSDE